MKLREKHAILSCKTKVDIDAISKQSIDIDANISLVCSRGGSRGGSGGRFSPKFSDIRKIFRTF